MPTLNTMDNQYLRPEDLPIIDAKKSPLAMLAMTCSNIGADIIGGSVKSSSSSDKNKKGSRSEGGDSRCDSVNSDKIQANSIDSNRSNSRNSSGNESTTIPNNTSSSSALNNNNSTHHLNGNAGHGNGSHSNCSSPSLPPKSISFKPYEDLPNNHHHHHSMLHHGHQQQQKSAHDLKKESSMKRPHNHSSPSSTHGSSPSSKRLHSLSPSTNSKVSPSSSSHHKVSTSPSLPTTSSSSSSSGPFTSPSSIGSAASIMNHHPPSSTHLNHHHHPSLCRDPFCASCQLHSLPGLRTNHASPSSSSGVTSSNGPSNCCPPSPSSGSSASSATSSNSSSSSSASTSHPSSGPPPPHPHHLHPSAMNPFGHPFPPSPLGFPGGNPMAAMAAAAAASRYGSATGSPSRPFMCHWTAGGTYCGKSFGACEDLLQHLKSHTLSSSAASYMNSMSAMGPYYGASPQHLSSLNSMRSASLDALRYHPYGKPPTMPHSGGHLGQNPMSRSGPHMGSPFGPAGSLLPGASMFGPAPPHPNLSSYYALLNSGLGRHGGLP